MATSKRKQPAKFSRPPIIMVLPGELAVLLKDGYGYSKSRHVDDDVGEKINKLFQKATTPDSLALYENAIDEWADKAPEFIVDLVEEYWLPVRTEELSLLPYGVEVKTNLTNPAWSWVVASDYGEIGEHIFALLAEPTEDWGWDIDYVPVPEMIKRLPPLPPEPGERFRPYQYEAITEIAEELSISKRSVNRRIREGKSIEKYSKALTTNVPAVSLKALNRNINLEQLYGEETVTKKERNKIDKLAESYGVSTKYFLRVVRGQKPLTRTFT